MDPAALRRGGGSQPDLFVGHEHSDWLGTKRNVYCVDFSVGGRHVERREGAGTAETPFLSKLGAVRWPERTVMFDDGSTLVSSNVGRP